MKLLKDCAKLLGAVVLLNQPEIKHVEPAAHVAVGIPVAPNACS